MDNGRHPRDPTQGRRPAPLEYVRAPRGLVGVTGGKERSQAPGVDPELAAVMAGPPDEGLAEDAPPLVG